MSIAAAPDDAVREITDYQSRVSYLIGAIANEMITNGTQFFRREFGIGVAEVRLMYVLGYETVLTARQAAAIIGVDKAAISRTLAGLERRGLVTTTVDPADARQRLIQFTASGRALHRRLMPAARRREEALVSVLSDDEVLVLSGLLRRLQAHVSRPRDPAPAGKGKQA